MLWHIRYSATRRKSFPLRTFDILRLLGEPRMVKIDTGKQQRMAYARQKHHKKILKGAAAHSVQAAADPNAYGDGRSHASI